MIHSVFYKIYNYSFISSLLIYQIPKKIAINSFSKFLYLFFLIIIHFERSFLVLEIKKPIAIPIVKKPRLKKAFDLISPVFGICLFSALEMCPLVDSSKRSFSSLKVIPTPDLTELVSLTCHLLFVTLTYPVENTRVYKRASSPLCFLCVYVAFSSQQTTRTHWRK